MAQDHDPFRLILQHFSRNYEGVPQLAAGFPIATDVIEDACRYLVKDHMAITGARWSVPGPESVLRPRALRASGDFESYWAFHQECELRRNHLSLYPSGNRAGDAYAWLHSGGEKPFVGR